MERHSSQGPPLRLFLLNPPLEQMFRRIVLARGLFSSGWVGRMRITGIIKKHMSPSEHMA
jgi:hypothetical protein